MEIKKTKPSWEDEIKHYCDLGKNKEENINAIFHLVEKILRACSNKYEQIFNMDDKVSFINFVATEITLFIWRWKYNPLKPNRKYPIYSVERFFLSQASRYKRLYFSMERDYFRVNVKIIPEYQTYVCSRNNIKEEILRDMYLTASSVNIDAFIKEVVNREIIQDDNLYENVKISLKLSLNKPEMILFNVGEEYKDLLIVYKNIINKKILDDICDVDHQELVEYATTALRDIFFDTDYYEKK